MMMMMMMMMMTILQINTDVLIMAILLNQYPIYNQTVLIKSHDQTDKQMVAVLLPSFPRIIILSALWKFSGAGNSISIMGKDGELFSYKYKSSSDSMVYSL